MCDYESGTIHKVGTTNNNLRRESQLITGNIEGKMIFSIKCLNKKLIETLVHQLLDKYRVNVKREWFKCDLQTVKNAIHYAKLVTEDMLECNISVLLENFKQFISVKNRETTVKKIIPLTEKYPKEMILDISEFKVFEQKNPQDYKLFLQQCCDINIDYTISKLELKYQYHLWCHNSEHKHWT